MKKVCFFITFLFFCAARILFGEPAPTEDEALHVRRILEFWKDHDPQVVKGEIAHFFKEYPESSYRDSLLLILGDVYCSEGAYRQALAAYDRITAPEYRENVLTNRLDCLYRLGSYDKLLQETMDKATTQKGGELSDQEALLVFYYAEALLHRGNGDGSDGKHDTFREAARHYERLTGSVHEANARLALGEIESEIGSPSEAVKHYLTAAQQLPDQHDELTLHAARLEGEYDPQAASQLYDSLIREGGKAGAAAALSKAHMLFSKGLYQKVIEEDTQMRQALSGDEKSLLDFYVGRSYFALQEYDKAVAVLEPLLVDESFAGGENGKPLLLTFIACYWNLNRNVEVIFLAETYEERYPSDPTNGRVMYIKSMALRDAGRLDEALAVLDRLLKEYPKFEGEDNARFERALVLFKLKRWKESRDQLISYHGDFAGTKNGDHALIYIAHASQKILEDAVAMGKEASTEREEAVKDIKNVLACDPNSMEVHRNKYLLKLGNLLFELKRYPEAMETLKEFVEKHPDDPHLYQGHLLLAYSYREGGEDLVNFTTHGEEVLRLNEKYPESESLRLHLFAAYLQLGKPKAESEPFDEVYRDKAAEHLFHVLMVAPESVKRENKFWLANYYYSKIAGGSDDWSIDELADGDSLNHAKRSGAIYSTVLETKEITPDTLYLEQEMYKCSNCFGWQGEREKQLALLEQLLKQQTAHPNWAWTLSARTLYSAARGYQKSGNGEKALELYAMLIDPAKRRDPHITASAKLEWARLGYELLPVAQRHLDDPQMMQILKALKELQLHKALTQEPIHLEAGLEYVEKRVAVEPPDKSDTQKLLLLGKLKEGFTTREDLWSKDYYASRQLHPDKDFIYHAYMMLIDAHIIRLEARIAAAQGAAPEAEVKSEAARSIYKTLSSGKFAVSKYLADQAKSSLQELDENE